MLRLVEGKAPALKSLFLLSNCFFFLHLALPCLGYFEMLQIPGPHSRFSELESLGVGLGEFCVFEPALQVKLKLVALEVSSNQGLGTTEPVSFHRTLNGFNKQK